MPSLRLLPGETVLHRLRPHPWSFALAYAMACLQGAAALLLHGVLTSDGWAAGSQGPWWQPWRFVYGNAVIAALLAAIVLAAFTAGAAASLRFDGRGYALTAALQALALAALGFTGLPYQVGLPSAVGTAAMLVLLLAETMRRTSGIWVTNLRVAARRGFLPVRRAQARHADVADVDVRQGWAARLWGSGSLAFVLHPEHATPGPDPGDGDGPDKSDHAVVRGVSRVRFVRDLVEVLVQEVSASPSLRAEQGTSRRKAELLSRLRRP